MQRPGRDLVPKLGIGGIATGGKRYARRAELQGFAGRYGLDADYAAGCGGDQARHARLQPEVDGSGCHHVPMDRLDYLEYRYRLFVAPYISPCAVRFVHHARHRRFRRQFQSQILQPMQRFGGVAHRQTAEHRINPAVGDALRVLVVLLGTVLYAKRGLLARAGSAYLAGRPVKCSSDTAVGFNLQHARAAQGCENGGRKAG